MKNQTATKTTTLLALFLSLSTTFAAEALIPSVDSCEPRRGAWIIPSSNLSIATADESAFYIEYIEQEMLPNVSVEIAKRSRADIAFEIDPDIVNEGYRLTIAKGGVEISSSSDAGALYGLQTLEQLIYQSSDGTIEGRVINDAPRCGWRTFMLDSGRQYQRVETIKKYLDMMFHLKMNRFHWHLTEGLGWRIEIKKYPELAKRGSMVGSRPEQHGYYTQEQIKEIIEYAADRNIMILPEIDVPGHAEAALSVYPEYGCFGEMPEIPNPKFTSTIFCGGKASTDAFLKDIFDEVCELFPSPYIHIGGDEAPKDNWDRCPDCQAMIEKNNLKDSHDLQRFFSYNIAEYLKTKGKKAMFYCDVLGKDGYKLSQNSAIMWWNYVRRKDMPLKYSLENGLEVLCGTNENCYLNFPLTPWSGYQPKRTFDIRDVYESNPSYVRDDNPLILGMSCALWTDYNVREYMIDRRLFPRIFALAEQMWRKAPLEDFDLFMGRVKSIRPLFEQRGYEFGPALTEEVPADYKWD